ncbi:MAG: hypothetical protein P4L28_07960 [Paludibacteraceae bacterium]|nr:hypothetical protein [Paludibacteraceae bacterium]
MENEFNVKLIKWAEEAANYCHSVATDPDSSKRIDKTFYVFQSEPVESPEVLILGINPHGNYSYADQYNNPLWRAEKQKITAEVFRHANPTWENRDSWNSPIWPNIKKVFNTQRLQEIINSCENGHEPKFVYMNALYFNTNNMDDFYKLPNSNEVFNKCIGLTKELISDIIKPKFIICLSIPECFNRLNEAAKTELLLNNKIRLLVKGEFCGIPTYGILHTSGSRNMTNDDWHQIGIELHKEIVGKVC